MASMAIALLNIQDAGCGKMRSSRRQCSADMPRDLHHLRSAESRSMRKICASICPLGSLLAGVSSTGADTASAAPRGCFETAQLSLKSSVKGARGTAIGHDLALSSRWQRERKRGGEGKQDKGSVSQHGPSTCLHILFSRDMVVCARDSAPQSPMNTGVLAASRETRALRGVRHGAG